MVPHLLTGLILGQITLIAGEAIINYTMFGDSIFGDPQVTKRKSFEFYDNPEENGPYLEGDLLVPIYRKGGLMTSTLWPSANIPYELKGPFRQSDTAMLQRIFKRFAKRTCIRFVERTNERDYLRFVNTPTGCWSSIGKLGGPQELNLQSPLCFKKIGTAQHEMLHALGFIHEHNRDDRDDFVIIAWQNIVNGREKNFHKMSQPGEESIDYDYASLLHYSSTSFSKNGNPTIVSKTSPRLNKYMGQRIHFSHLDVYRINKLYNCNR